MIQCFYDQALTLPERNDSRNEGVEKEVPLKSGIFELSNKLLSLEVGLKLKERKMIDLSTFIEEKEEMIKSFQDQFSMKDQNIVDDNQLIEKLKKFVDIATR
jgi:hypothetical protein